MSEKYAIVFGEHSEQQLKKHFSRAKSYKEASWLYDGLVYRDEITDQEIVSIIFKDPQFAPSAIVDNNKWLSPSLFGNNQKIWHEALGQCLTMARREDIRFYAYFD